MPHLEKATSTCPSSCSTPSSRSKAALRAAFRQARRDLAPGEQAALSASIVGHILSWLDALASQPRTVSIYLASPSEADLDGLIEPLRARGILVAAPRGDGFAVVEAASTCTAPAGQSWRQAPGDWVPAEEIEVALLPGVAFGRDGSRLGQGGGWFDRALAGSQAIVAGVAFSCQVTDALPREEHDVPVAWIASEDGVAPASR